MKILLVGLFLAFNFLLSLPSNAQYVVLHSFDDTTGANPLGDLTLSGSNLYGMTKYGGAHKYGCIFSIDTNGSRYRDLFDFDSLNGKNPFGSLIISEGKLYGMTWQGGANGIGLIFSLDTNGSRYKDLLDFDSTNGAFPCGNLTLSGGKMYGMTIEGGIKNAGCIFSIDTNGNNYKDLHDFIGGFNGAFPAGSLILYGNRLYGMTGELGAGGNIFSIDTNGSGYKNLLIFDTLQATQLTPAYDGSLIISGKALYGMTTKAAGNSNIFLLGNVFSIDTDGTNYKELFDFNPLISGTDPSGSLILVGNMLYGMTSFARTNNSGNIFSVDTDGNRYTDMYDFGYTVSNGSTPYGSLIFSGSTLYGMTYGGGTYGYGVIFKIDTSNRETASINNLTEDKGIINIYPNPNNGVFTIQSSAISGQSSVEVYDILGQQVYQSGINANNIEINLSTQPQGIYLYRVITETGELIGEGKIVIQR